MRKKIVYGLLLSTLASVLVSVIGVTVMLDNQAFPIAESTGQTYVETEHLAYIILGTQLLAALLFAIGSRITVIPIVKKVEEALFLLKPLVATDEAVQIGEDLGVLEGLLVVSNVVGERVLALEVSLKAAIEKHEVCGGQLRELKLKANETRDQVIQQIQPVSVCANDGYELSKVVFQRMDSLGRYIEENKKNMPILHHTVSNVMTLRGEGTQLLHDLLAQATRARIEAEKIGEIIRQSNESSKRIELASEMIKNISKQTNLLALNASIEAARVGEEGKGFAVVAEEIRALAEQSDAFAKDIERIVFNLTSETDQAVQTITDINRMVGSQKSIMDRSDEIYEGIDQALNNMNDMIGTVVHLGQEMEDKKDEVIQVMEKVYSNQEFNIEAIEEIYAVVDASAKQLRR